MNFTQKITGCFLLVLVITGAVCCKSNSKEKHSFTKKPQSPDKHVGEKFSIENFIDTSGKPVKIDLSTSDITIIDFWMNECPPCNEDMSQFNELIKGKDKKISIISISVSNFLKWKQLFIDKQNKRYAFLHTAIPNWKHLTLLSKQKPSPNELHVYDRVEELYAKLSFSSLPTYFVLDKNGIIIDRPVSAVEYIKSKVMDR